MANVTDARYWLTTLLTLTLVATTLVGQKAEVDDPLVVRGTEYSRASGGEALAIEVPKATEPGDLLVAVVAINGPSVNSPGDEWSLVRSDSRGGELTQALWVRQATEDEPGVHKWSGGNRRTVQVGTIVAVGSNDLGEVRLLDAGAAAHRLDPVVLPGLHAEADGALLLGAFSLSGTETLEASDDAMTTLDSIDGAITLTTAHQTVAAGDTGERVIKRETSGGAASQLLLIERVPATNNAEDAPEEPVENDDSTEPDDALEDVVDDSEGNENDEVEADEDEAVHDGHDEHGEHDGHADEGDGAEEVMHTAQRWLDAATWPDGTIPTSHTDVEIDGHVVIDGNASARTVIVTPGSTLEFAADADAQLQAFGNVVVEGTLKMQPAGYDIDHALRFFGVDEEAYVGGGHHVLETDTGLWFTGQGHARLAGSHRLPWTRAVSSLTAGAKVIELEDSPHGWQRGDEIVITPTSPPGTPGFSDGYSTGHITAVDGKKVALDTPLAFDHPRVNGQWGAEVMNMTRNVRIEGTAEGRAHIQFNHTHVSQHIANTTIRYMGPRQDTGSTYKDRTGETTVERAVTAPVMGRYPLHFHHNGTHSIGTTLTNVVVRDSGNRAFVAHASDGIAFTGTIAHQVAESAYWWDRRDTSDGLGSSAKWERGSHDISYHRAIASRIVTDPPNTGGHRLAGFELGHGENVSVTDSVAVGVQGRKHAAGFVWPEGSARDPETGERLGIDHWVFERNVSHNNRHMGMFVWQNNSNPNHLIANSAFYHNGVHGIDHGAYTNAYKYRSLDVFGNGRSGVELHALGRIEFADLRIDGRGKTPYGFTTNRHRIDSSAVTLIRPEFTAYSSKAIALLSPDRERLDIVEPRFDGPYETWFYLHDNIPEDSEIRVQLVGGSAFRLHPANASIGTLEPAWNARVEPIEAWADTP